MKVREFIAKLQEQDQEAEVVFQGSLHDMREEVDDPPCFYDTVDHVTRSRVSLAHSQVLVSISHDAYP